MHGIAIPSTSINWNLLLFMFFKASAAIHETPEKVEILRYHELIHGTDSIPGCLSDAENNAENNKTTKKKFRLLFQNLHQKKS